METSAKMTQNNNENDETLPQVLTPESFDESNLDEPIKKSQTGKILARSYRMLVITLIPVVLFGAISIMHRMGKTVSIITMYGYALLLMYLGYIVHIMVLFCSGACKGRTLYRMYSINIAPSDWSPMSITYRQLVFKDHPITSISEFSAVGGGLAYNMLLTLSSYNWAILMCGIAIKINACDSVSGDDIVMIFGGFGLVIIGTFELDPFNIPMQYMHTAGAVIGLGTVIGYTWQQIRYATVLKDCTNSTLARIWSPILLDIIAVVGFIGWRISHKKSNDYGKSSCKKESKKVSCLTLYCVIFEAIFLYAGAISQCLWLIFYDYYPSCNGISDKSYACFTKREYHF